MADLGATTLRYTGFDGRGFTDANTLARARLTAPDLLNEVTTHLMGRESAKLPLTYMSEGQPNGIKYISGAQFSWPVIGRMKRHAVVKATPYTSSDLDIGAGGSVVEITFDTNWFKSQMQINGPGDARIRLLNDGDKVAGGYKYFAQQITNDNTAAISYSALAPNSVWAILGPAVSPMSRSRGTLSNVVTPGEKKGQIGLFRKSFAYGGNIRNQYVNINLPVGDNGWTKVWTDFERWQHELNWRETLEENWWFSKYNRLADGSIYNVDPETNQPVPTPAGIVEQIVNSATYSDLTTKILKDTVRHTMFGATDTGKMLVTLYTGTGGAEEFDDAIKAEGNGFQMVANSNVGDKFVTGSGRSLMLGGFFTAYEHIDGHVITVRKLPMLDIGGKAESADRHYRTGLPLSSHDMYFVDQSIYDGLPNIQMVVQKGRGMVSGTLRGMAATPDDFMGNDYQNISLATDRDESSFHMMCAKGPMIRRNTHCFKLLCDAAG